MPPRQAPGAPTRNPVARSLALAVLSLALIVAVIMGAFVFAVLLAVLAVGYAVSLVRAWWRLAKLRRRAAFVDDPRSQAASVELIDAEYEVIEVTGDAAPRPTSGGPV